MKRFACHYLYASADGYYSRYVVEVNDNAEVGRYFPLMEEISATQWIGGVIVLSASAELQIDKQENFHAFLQRATAEADGPRYAWHVMGVDLLRKEFNASCSLVRL